MLTITVEKIENGYLIHDTRLTRKTKYAPDAQTLFRELLMDLEGRSESFGGDSYGVVFVLDKPSQTATGTPPPAPA